MIAEWLMKVISNMVLSHVVSLLALVAFNVFVFLKGKLTPLSKSFHLLALGPFLWLGGKVVKIVAPNLGLRWTGILIQYLGMALIGPSFFLFCLISFLHRRPRSGATVAIFALPALVYALIASNPLHGQFYTIFTMYRDAFGPVFYLNSWLIYGYLTAGGLLLAIELFRRERKYRTQILLFLAAALVPLATSLYYPRVGDLHSGLRFDITPVSFNLSFLCFGIAAFRYDFLDLPRIAFSQVLAALREGIVVKDEEGTILYANAAGQRFPAPPEDGQEAGRYSAQDSRFAYWRGSFHATRGSFHATRGSLSMVAVRDVTLEAQRTLRLKENAGRLRKLTADIRQKIEEERSLLLLEQRNAAAQELHDVLGHSLTLIIAQLEAVRLISDTASQDAILERALAMAKEGAAELDVGGAPSGARSAAAGPFPSALLSGLIDRGSAAGLKIELAVSRPEPPLGAELGYAVYAICRECVTNALRHGGADHVVISLHCAEAISLRVLDNGSGCGAIVEGTGLSGIRARVAALGGNVRFSSDRGEGFAVSATFPGKIDAEAARADGA